MRGDQAAALVIIGAIFGHLFAQYRHEERQQASRMREHLWNLEARIAELEPDPEEAPADG